MEGGYVCHDVLPFLVLILEMVICVDEAVRTRRVEHSNEPRSPEVRIADDRVGVLETEREIAQICVLIQVVGDLLHHLQLLA